MTAASEAIAAGDVTVTVTIPLALYVTAGAWTDVAVGAWVTVNGAVNVG